MRFSLKNVTLVISLASLSVAFAICATAQAQSKSTIPSDLGEKVDFRSIGPANMMGRITALAIYEKDPCIWWAASASGGLIKTTNNGINFEHQFDKEATVSIGDVQVAQSDPKIVWVGTGESNPRNSVSWGDGVYKSVDGGKTWKNMGLKKIFQTGAIAIHPTDPDTVYIGALGRLWGPNVERGLFKTTDGGKTWTKVFYINDKTGIIDVQLKPDNPDELLIATYERQRDGFDGNDPEKKYGAGSGIYRSIDAGKSFSKVTKGLPTCKLGRIGFDYYRKDPNFVFAVVESEKIAKEPEDTPFVGIRAEDADVGARLTSITKDGPAQNAGLKEKDIVVSVDGAIVHSYQGMLGEIRKHRAGDKVNLVVSRDRENVDIELTLAKKPKRPERKSTNGRARTRRTPFTGTLGGQAANLQEQQGEDGHEYGGVYMSSDSGNSWTRINSLNPRPMYYSHIRVDPTDRNYVYLCGTSLYRSKDGGKTFKGDGGNDNIHVDHHALWIDPRDSRHMILGNDGGIYVTYDRMDHWDHHNHAAFGQFYHVGVDSNLNYRVYGGLQDNGSWGGPSRSADGNGIKNTDWYRVGGGDGFLTVADPDDPDQIYFESQNGGMGRINLRTGERGFIRPRPPKGTRYRFNWKSPFILSPHNTKVYYSAGNHVFRSFNKGDKIKSISPEITNTDKGAGSALTESPVEAGVLYVGTTDGAVWMTKDGGKEWLPLFHSPEEKDEKQEETGTKTAQEEIKDESTEQKDPDSEESTSDTGDDSSDAKDPLSGKWEGKLISDRIPEGRGDFTFELKLTKDGKVSGEMEGFRGNVSEFSDGTFDAKTGDVAFVIEGERGDREYTAKLNGETLTGEMSAGGGRFQVDFEAKRVKKDPAAQNENALSAFSLAQNSAITLLMLTPGDDDPVSGTWTASLENENLPGGKVDVSLELSMNDKGAITGVLISPVGEADVEEGTYDKDSKNLTVVAADSENGFEIEISAKIDGSTMSGTLNVNDQIEIDMEATKTETAKPADAPADTESKAEAKQDTEADPKTESKKASKDEPDSSETSASSSEPMATAETSEDTPSSIDDPVSGEWKGEFESPRGASEFTISLRLDDENKVKGSYVTERSDGDFSEGKYDPETKKLELTSDNGNFSLDWTADLADEKMVGEIDFNGGQFSMTFEAQRTEKAKQKSDAQQQAKSTAGKKEDATDSSENDESSTGPTLAELLPGPRWVSSLEASRFKAERCYATFDGHRSNDDLPYLFVTEDYGQSWKSIKGNLPNQAGSVRVLREDVKNENLLYLGCEFGAWFSIDRGLNWTKFSDLPTVAVHEIAVHPKAGDIVAGTHGRSLWIADVSTLQQTTAATLAKSYHLYKPKDVTRWRNSQTRGDNGAREFKGEDPKTGTTIAYSLSQRARSIDLFVVNLKGAIVKRFEDVSTRKGLHTFDWDLRTTPRTGRGRGASIPSGDYLVHLRVNGKLEISEFSVQPDPNFDATNTAEQLELEQWLELFGEIN